MSALPAPAETFKTDRDIANDIHDALSRHIRELYDFIESHRAFDESDGRLAGIGVRRARIIDEACEGVRELSLIHI